MRVPGCIFLTCEEVDEGSVSDSRLGFVRSLASSSSSSSTVCLLTGNGSRERASPPRRPTPHAPPSKAIKALSPVVRANASL